MRLLAALVAITQHAAAAELNFREHLIAGDLKGGYQVVAVDMNRDGKTDLIALASGLTELVWFENPTWQRHVIAGKLSRMINVAPSDTAPLDKHGDGVPELALALAHEFANQAKNSTGVVSVLRHQGDPRKLWKVTEIDRLTTSHRLRWADIDGSGSKVLINAPLSGARAEPPDYRDAAPLVFYRPGAWKREMITDANQGVVHGILIERWDGGKRDHVFTASFLGIHRHYLDKSGMWQRVEISRGNPAPWPASGSSDVAVGKVKTGRFLAAIEPWHGNQVAVYRETARNGFARTVIDDSLVDGHTILTVDFDRDGNDEIVAGFRGAGRSVYIYWRRKGEDKWDRQTLDDGGIAAAGCAAADLNGDRRLDVACIGSATANLKWYENAGRRK